MSPATIVFIVITALAYAAIGSPQQPNLEDIGKIQNGETYALECLLESGLKIDSLKSLQTGDFSNGEQVKCLVKCFFEKTGFMDSNGNLNEDAIVKQLSQLLPQDRVDALVKNCNTKGTDACDTAYKATECYFQNKAGIF